MKIILQEDIERVGRMGQMIEVKNGFARNYLIPWAKAVEATTRNLRQLEHTKRVVAQKAKKAKDSTKAFARQLVATRITIAMPVGQDGKLFGSVTSKDIAAAVAQQGLELDRRKIALDHPIKELGSFVIPVKLPHEVTASLTVNVSPEQDAQESAPPQQPQASDESSKAPSEE